MPRTLAFTAWRLPGRVIRAGSGMPETRPVVTATMEAASEERRLICKAYALEPANGFDANAADTGYDELERATEELALLNETYHVG